VLVLVLVRRCRLAARSAMARQSTIAQDRERVWFQSMLQCGDVDNGTAKAQSPRPVALLGESRRGSHAFRRRRAHAPRLPQNPPPARAPAPPSLSTWLHLIFTLHLTFTLHSLHSTHLHSSVLSDSPPHLPAHAIHIAISANLQPRLPSHQLQATAMPSPYAACTFDGIHPVWS
jgi:hypothetical protein